MASINSSKQQEQLLSKMATNDRHGENSSYFDGWKAYDRDPYHPTRNQNGVLQMGLAENQLCLDMIEEWILDNPHASICTNQGIRQFKEIAIFQDYHGLPEFRQGVASFMGRARGNKVKFDPDRIVMSGGATGASETIMFCLADPGDAFLVPSPYYPAFNRDLRWRTGVELIPVPCSSSNGFTITRTALEQAYDQATKSGVRVKGLILSNPSNPLGTVLDRSTLTSLAHFANQHRIHLVVDEIYAATVFRSPEFVSLSEVLATNPQLDHDLFHVIYSLSKDMGLPGFRVGIVYSYNDAVVSCARKMSSFGLVSSETQRLLASMLSDSAFMDRFLAESRRRLERRHRRFTEEVARVGINCLRSNAGLFAWMDLRHLLGNNDDHNKTTIITPEEAELELWRTVVNEVKINVSPGLSFGCSEPGWFRVCYANMDDETLEVALNRIKRFARGSRNSGTFDEEESDQAAVLSMTNTGSTRKLQVNNNKRWQKKLRLSFTDRVSASVGIRVDGDDRWRAMSPQIASPHSPMPCSPLVKART